MEAIIRWLEPDALLALGFGAHLVAREARLDQSRIGLPRLHGSFSLPAA
jgi:hypothetical protein